MIGGKNEMLLSVAEPGRPRYGYRWTGRLPARTFVVQGQDLPVAVAGGNVDIEWDRLRATAAQGWAAADPGGALGRYRGVLSRAGVDPALLAGAGSGRTRLDYQAHVARIMTSGTEMAATIRSFAVGDAAPGMNATMTQLVLAVEPPGAPPYEATFTQPLPPAITATLAAGQRVTVRVARDDPRAVMLWNTPHAAGGVDPDDPPPQRVA